MYRPAAGTTGERLVKLTESAAKELGRKLDNVRVARRQTLKDLKARSEISPQYVHNILHGTENARAVSDDVYDRLARGLGLPPDVMGDLVLRARTVSALEHRGVSTDDAAFAWRGVEERLRERGIDVQTDVRAVIVDILA